jgi:hypothetical protein
MIGSPIFFARLIDHYEDRVKDAKTEEERIFLMEKLYYYRLKYIATQN